MTEKTRFEWDENKNASNKSKHGVSLEEAARVFEDPLHITRQDRVVGYEERWQTIGSVYGVTLLLVAHTVTEANEDGEFVEVIRIISARPVTKHERKRYEQES